MGVAAEGALGVDARDVARMRRQLGQQGDARNTHGGDSFPDQVQDVGERVQRTPAGTHRQPSHASVEASVRRHNGPDHAQPAASLRELCAGAGDRPTVCVAGRVDPQMVTEVSGIVRGLLAVPTPA
jgi:hypothetical protein